MVEVHVVRFCTHDIIFAVTDKSICTAGLPDKHFTGLLTQNVNYGIDTNVQYLTHVLTFSVKSNS
jgi:hypothetical protein